MKRLGLIYIGVLLSGILGAQNPLVEYSYWFNRDDSSIVSNILSPSSVQSLQIQMDASALEDGMNLVHWRFRDQNGLYSAILSGVFYKNSEILSSNRNLVEYEYWLNDSYSQHISQSIAPQSSQYLVSDLIDVDSLLQGVNTFHIRFRDEMGFWSSSYSSFFVKNDETNYTNRKLTSYDYWFNSNTDSMQSVTFSPQASFDLSHDFDVHDLEEGVNVVHIRFWDETGLSSAVLSKMYYKNTEQIALGNEVISVEYWVDQEVGNKQTISATGAEFLWLDNLNFQQLEEGAHFLNYRFRDPSGVYSSTNTQVFYKKGDEVLNPVITDYRYWFNHDSSGVFSIQISNPVEQFNLMDGLDMRGLPSGNHDVHFQFRDSTGTWSSILTQTVFKNPYPIADFSYAVTSNCDSTVVDFTDLSIDAETHLWDFGDGSISTSPNPSHTYFLPGLYTVELLVSDTSVMLDSSIQYAIQVFGNTTANFATTQCESYTTPSGSVLTTSGVYLDTIPNTFGCDSIITIDLTINQPGQYTEVQTSCGPFTWIDGSTYTSSTQAPVYVITGGSANGCDSIISLDLTVHSPTASVDVITACDSYTWLDGNTYTASNSTATWITTNAAGCDSVITLNLTVQNSSTATDVISACDSYTWIDGVTYTSSNNTATYILTNAAGCDSVVSLDLTVNYSNTGLDVITSCGSYTWIDGQTYTSSNSTATWTLSNAYGCDSLVSLDLTVIHVDTQVIATPTTLEATATNATFQWLDCNNNYAPIAGANDSFFQPLNNGVYAVEIQQNGCTDTTMCYPITQIGLIESPLATEYIVFPNPASNVVNIQGSFKDAKAVTIELLNLHGQVVAHGGIVSSEKAKIEMDLPDGVYLVVITNGKSSFTYRIIIQR